MEDIVPQKFAQSLSLNIMFRQIAPNKYSDTAGSMPNNDVIQSLTSVPLVKRPATYKK